MSGYRAGIFGTTALVIAHCAGMIDLIALPVWVGALVERFGFRPQEAGGLVTLFLCGAVAASVAVAPRLNRLNQRMVSAIGFSLAALAFAIASRQSALWPLAALHLLAGLSVGTALSVVHGTMGRSANPHRLFALAGIAIGLFAIVLLAAIPQLVIAFGGAALFTVFAAVMAIAAIACALFFVNPQPAPVELTISFSRAVWFTILGVSVMTFNQAMVFSFVEVIGKTRGFGAQGVLGVSSPRLPRRSCKNICRQRASCRSARQCRQCSACSSRRQQSSRSGHRRRRSSSQCRSSPTRSPSAFSPGLSHRDALQPPRRQC